MRNSANTQGRVSVRRISVGSMLNDFGDMLEAHWRVFGILELGDVPLVPDLDGYRKAASLGEIVFYGAYDENFTPVGYISVRIGDHLHRDGLKVAQTDMIYVAPEFSGMGAGRALLGHAERELAAIGITTFSVASRCHSPITGFLEEAGYRADEVVYIKKIGE